MHKHPLHPHVLALLAIVLTLAVSACTSEDIAEDAHEVIDAAHGDVELEPDPDYTPYPTEEPSAESPLIHQLRLGPSNAYLIEAPQGLILVDTSLGVYAHRILDEIERLDKGPLCLIYITHAHIDHFAGANAIRAASGAPVAVHEADADAMAAGVTRLGTVRNWDWTAPWMPWVERLARVDPTPADILLQDGDPITMCGVDGESVWTPGHTPGSSSMLVRIARSNAGPSDSSRTETHIFVGDLIANSGDPRIQRTYAQKWSDLLPSVLRTTALAPDYYHIGHGATPLTLQQVQEMEVRGPAARD